MGTWGAGNFDNDAALDYAGDINDGLVNTINEIFADPDRFYLDEDAEGMLMPSVEMLTILPGAPPPAADVEGWKTRYLALYDEQIDYLEPADGYKEERRQVIVSTFDKLIEKARDFWRE